MSGAQQQVGAGLTAGRHGRGVRWVERSGTLMSKSYPPLGEMLSPLVIDTFLLDYHLGHVLLLTFVLSLLGTLPLKSRKVIAAVVITFGVIFTISPFSTMPATYILFGIGLVVVGPLLWTTADS